MLDEWQCWVLLQALGERVNFTWAAFEVCLLVPRQNGKGTILEALELYHLFVLHTPLIIHSAHEFSTANEHFLRLVSVIEENADLYAQVCPGSGGYIHTSAQDRAIHTASGGRLKFLARSGGSARGFSADLVVLDEAYKLPEQAVGAMGPAMSARPNAQIWYTSSAPHSGSLVLHGVRKRGLEKDGDRLFFAEWGNDPGVELSDETAKYRVNPGWPHRLSTDNLEAEAQMLKGMDNELLRERFGIPEDPIEGSSVFGPGMWQACLDPKSAIEGEPQIALAVSPGMTFSSFAASGFRSDGLTHVEMIERNPGTGWVVARAKALTEKWGRPLLVRSAGPVGGLLKELVEAGVPIEELGAGEYPKSCAHIQEMVIGGTLRHLGQPPLDAAVSGAAIKPAGDSWRWSMSASSVDISSLEAVTIAAGKLGGGRVEMIVL